MINFKKKFSDDELYFFPKDVKDIETKSRNYKVQKTSYYRRKRLKELCKKAPQFGNYLLEYGINLLENGDLIKAGFILSKVNGSENFDNTWHYALFHKARIAAILNEFDYMIEFLRRAFRAAAYLEESPRGDEKVKEMIFNYFEFERYRKNPRLLQILAHNYNNPKDMEEYEKDFY